TARWIDSTRGVIHDVIPLTLEVPIYERIGLRLILSLVYYQSHFQTLVSPIYLEKSDGISYMYVALRHFILNERVGRGMA
ncbi:MAG TPA: hypothetical protein VGD24_01365, partial [Gallionella sp.]